MVDQVRSVEALEDQFAAHQALGQVAVERVGADSKARLAWLLDLVQRPDLEGLSAAELLRVALELHVFTMCEQTNQIARASDIQKPDKAAITRVVSTVRKGVDLLLRNQPWRLSTITAGKVALPVGQGRKRRVLTYYDGPLAGRFLSAAHDLLSAYFERLGSCAQCGRLFVIVKRGEYCSPACSHKARNLRYLAKQPQKQRRKLRHQYYRRQVERKRGREVAAKVRQQKR